MEKNIKKQELVSVIVPIYEVEEYLVQCIKSIQNQTYKNLEIILVDDGSPDSCGTICDRFKAEDDRIVVIHQKNGGLSYARNIGIEASHGDYLTFVDGDDWLDEDIISILVELCLDYDAEISECQYREVFSKTRSKNQSNTEQIIVMNSLEALENMLDWNYFKPMAWGKLYKKEVIGNIRFPLHKLHEDEFTTYKYIYNAHKLVHIDLVKYNYNRMRENSITSHFTAKNLDACEAFLERREFFRKYSIDSLEEKMNNTYCIIVLDTLYECYQNNIFDARIDLLLEQIKKDIAYLKDRPIDIYFINELIIASKSVQEYGQHRDEMESHNNEYISTTCMSKSYEDILRENKQLKEHIDALLNSRTWRYAEKAKKALGISKLISTFRSRKNSTGNKLTSDGINFDIEKTDSLEFNYEHLLSEVEYKFYKYRRNRGRLYPLDLTKIKIPCKKGMVSIVLPVYNGEDYVALSIESVLEQTYSDFELIIIDDGSTDTTPQIVDAYAQRDSRIKVVHQKNIRLPKTLSKGFRMAQGEFFTWTSADNIMHENFLERFVNDLENAPSVGMIWGNMRLIDENGCPIRDNEWYANSEYPEEVMFPKSILCLNVVANNYIGAAFMYRATCAHIVLDYSAFKFCTEDYDYWMKINELCVLRHTSFDDALYSYRFHSNSLTSKDKELKITENRYKLMLLDDFRRDYLLKPLIWYFCGNMENNPYYKTLKALVEKSGHIVANTDDILCLDENLYERAVLVNFNDENWNCSNIKIPYAYRVLISDCEKESKNEWDCYIKTCKTKDKNILTLGDYRGWYESEDCATIFSLIDAKAKSKFLYDLEEQMDYVMKNENSISILLCYSGNIKVLKECLLSIKSQDVNVEVILIYSDQKVVRDLAEIESFYPNIKIAKSLSSDKATQMNIGIWKSTGEIVVFGEPDYIYDADFFVELQKMMCKEQVKAVCGSVKCRGDLSEADRSLVNEHRFYADGLLKNIERRIANNISVKREELLMIGGLYHLSPEFNDLCILPSLYGLIQMIHKNRTDSVFKNRFCTVYRQNIASFADLDLYKESESVGFYELERQLIIPYGTRPECIKENGEIFSDEISKYFRAKVVEDFKIRSQVNWIREWYSTLESPMISIVVPVYNTEKELERCVDSLRAQTLENIEIILVDDGSKDSSGKICDEYAQRDRRIKVIHKANGGLSDARNCGINTACGTFIMFVDSDDWIDADMCETLYHVALQEKAEIVECSYRNIYPDHVEEETENTGKIITGNSTFALLKQLEWKYFKSVAWNKLYFRDIFSDGKRYPKGRFHEDEFFTHQAFYSATTLAYVDVSKYNYWHGRSNSITGSINENILDSCYALRSRVDFVVGNNIKEVEKPVKEMYCWMLFDRLYKCHKSGAEGTKLKQILIDIQKDKENVLSWDISEDYKREYKILLQSYDDFCKCRENRL